MYSVGSRRINMSTGEMIEQRRASVRFSSSSGTLSVLNTTCFGPILNLGVSAGKTVADRLRHGTASRVLLTRALDKVFGLLHDLVAFRK